MQDANLYLRNASNKCFKVMLSGETDIKLLDYNTSSEHVNLGVSLRDISTNFNTRERFPRGIMMSLRGSFG